MPEYSADADFNWPFVSLTQTVTYLENAQERIAQVITPPTFVSESATRAISSQSQASTSNQPLRRIKQLDPLVAYFPSTEQRHLFRHFLNETASSLVVIPTSVEKNPWLLHTIRLALGKPYGQDVYHDAFRTALISLASLDLGMKCSSTLQHPDDNTMYNLSDDQRTTALELLGIGDALNGKHLDLNAVDLSIGTTLALAVRDRLAGCQDWEEPMTIGSNLINGQGGPGAYVDRRPTLQTRFLIEQMACEDILVFVAPKIMTWDNPWLFWQDTGGNTVGSCEQAKDEADHLTVVYGWSRQALQACARSMILHDEHRQIGSLKERHLKYGYAVVDSNIKRRELLLFNRSKQLTEEVQTLHLQTMLSMTTPRVIRSVSCLLICLEVVILSSHLGQELNQKHIQAKVTTVLDMVDEAMTEGTHAGFLLPLVWMAVCITPDKKARVQHLFWELRQHYYLEPALMERLARFDWEYYATASTDTWVDEMRNTNTYVPVF
nr:uncharacterized protein CI109_005662 [Kwoniella shandongensis]KAA5526066.1 hypothetical protein CI109_005662 [Kwoniella shandongensis]